MTIKYKIRKNPFGDSSRDEIEKIGKCIIPRDLDNRSYQQFLKDVKEQGIDIVEGDDVITPDYEQQRLAEYPSLTDQQDMQYWDAVNGTTTWKDKINEIKTKYPKTNTGSTTVGDVPSWVQTEVNVLIKNDYVRAIERLKRPKVALGVKVLIADNYWDPELMKVIENEKYVYQNVPDPEDPRVLDDEKARSAAQAVIDATPQSIIDSINT